MDQIAKISPSTKLPSVYRTIGAKKSWWQKHRLELVALPGGLLLFIGLWSFIVAAAK